MWYKEHSKQQLDYNKPIVATSEGVCCLLLPVRAKDHYTIYGYDWFNTETGNWNSSRNFETPDEAVDCYQKMGYSIRNVEIKFI